MNARELAMVLAGLRLLQRRLSGDGCVDASRMLVEAVDMPWEARRYTVGDATMRARAGLLDVSRGPLPDGIKDVLCDGGRYPIPRASTIDALCDRLNAGVAATDPAGEPQAFGVTFAPHHAAVQVLAEIARDRKSKHRTAARCALDQWRASLATPEQISRVQTSDDLEIDDAGACVSHSDDGYWVSSWTWVEDREAEIDNGEG